MQPNRPPQPSHLGDDDDDTISVELKSDQMEMVTLLMNAIYDDTRGEQALQCLREQPDAAIDLLRKFLLDSWKPFVELNVTLTKIANQLGANAEPITRILMPHGSLRIRYGDHQEEKILLGKYLARQFFNQQIRCFVQASTTAIHMGEQLAAVDLDHCLFHTNSVIFPITVLRGLAAHSVYPFYGSIYDQNCGGWTFPLNDIEAATSLEELFRREKEPLTHAFLFPRAVNNQGIWYERAENAKMTKLLIQEAAQIVIVLTSDRIWNGTLRNVPNGAVQIPIAELQNHKSKVEIVVTSSSERAVSPLLSLAKAVHYYKIDHMGEGTWHVLTGDGSSSSRDRLRLGLAALRKLCGEQPIHSGGLRFTREELHERH